MIINTVLKRSGLLVAVATLYISVFGTVNAAVTFEIITGNSFIGQTTGPLGDPYWEGAPNDAPLTDFFDPATTGLNTIGSTGLFLAYDNLINFNFQFQSFGLGSTVYDNPAVFGDNVISSLTREAEIIGFGDGVTGTVQTLVGTNNVVTQNPNNTYSYTGLTTEDALYNYTTSSINAYLISAGEDPSTIFGSGVSGVGIFDGGINGPIDPLRVVAQFNYLAGEVGPLWTAIGIEFFQTTATAKDPTMFDDFEGLGYYSFVSYDAGASPVPVPAALPLLMSGLLGLFGIRRLRSNS